MSCGVYILKNLINNKLYIGQSLNINRRFCSHRTSDSFIGRAIKKYSWKNFKQYIFYIPENKLNYFEIEMIKRLNSLDPNGYNLKEGGSNGRFSDSVKKRMSENWHKRKPVTTETRQKISAGLFKAYSSGRRSCWNEGLTKETDSRVKRLAWSKGLTKETDSRVKRRSDVMKGSTPWNKDKIGCYSKETLRRISNSLKGPKNPNFGKQHSEQHRLKISESLKKYYQLNKKEKNNSDD